MSESFATPLPPAGDMRLRRDEIEQLWTQGYSTKEIAAKLGGTPLDVARNLREVRKRWQRAAARQEIVQGPRCAEVYREAMEGWRRSQQTKTTTTKHCQEGKPVKLIEREEERAGTCGFLRTALAALAAMERLAAKKHGANPQPANIEKEETEMPKAEQLRDASGNAANEVIASLLGMLPAEALERLDPAQTEFCRRAVEACHGESPEPPHQAEKEPAAEVPCSMTSDTTEAEAVAAPSALPSGEAGFIPLSRRKRKGRAYVAPKRRARGIVSTWRSGRPLDSRATGRRRSRQQGKREANGRCNVPARALPGETSSLGRSASASYSAPTRVLLPCGTETGPLSGRENESEVRTELR